MFLFIPGYSRLLSAAVLLLAKGIFTFAICSSSSLGKKRHSRLAFAVILLVVKRAFAANLYLSLQKGPSIATDQKGVHHQPSGKLEGLVWSFGLNNPLIQVRPISNQSQDSIWHLVIFEHPQRERAIFFFYIKKK